MTLSEAPQGAAEGDLCSRGHLGAAERCPVEQRSRSGQRTFMQKTEDGDSGRKTSFPALLGGPMFSRSEQRSRAGELVFRR